MNGPNIPPYEVLLMVAWHAAMVRGAPAGGTPAATVQAASENALAMWDYMTKAQMPRREGEDQ